MKIITGIITVLLLSGCATEQQAQSIAMASAQAHCAAAGLQFVYAKTDKVPGAVPGLVTDVTVSGYCK